MKYILHPSYELFNAADIKARNIAMPFDDTILNQIQKQELFVVGSIAEDNLWVVNPSIHFFLQLFKMPSTFSEVLTQFAQEAQCTEGEAQPIVQHFLTDMLNRQIIISNRKAQQLKKINTNSEIQSQPENTFLHFNIIKNLKEIPSNFTYISLATDTLTGEKVVLKRLDFPNKISIKEQKYWRKLFFQEFELMQEIGSHAHICRIKSLDTEGGYAVLEYVEGIGLRDFLGKHELSLNQKYFLIFQILTALAAVHEKRILHGDIHASNFLVDNHFNVKLIDFDLANREKPKRYEWVNEGGVYEYIPPEKINKNSFEIIKERSDYRSEVYQLGVIIYIIFFNRLPFEAMTWHELTDKIMNQEPLFEQYNNDDVPDSIILFLKKSMSKNPLNRYSNASEMLREWLYLFE